MNTLAEYLPDPDHAYNWPQHLTLITVPSRVLFTSCRNCEQNVPHWIIDEMRTIMKENNGVGLTAPQVGIPLQFFVTADRVFINPRILAHDDEMAVEYEGCISIPNFCLPIARFLSIRVQLEESADEISTGLDARIIQHEIDHLNGVLFPARYVAQLQSPTACAARMPLVRAPMFKVQRE